MKLKQMVRVFEKQIIVDALKRFNGHQTNTSVYLGIHRNDLIFKMHAYGLKGKTKRWRGQ